MEHQSKTFEFLAKAENDPKLGARLLAAIERGNKVTAEEVLQIAKEFGYSITRDEFEKDAQKNITERFEAGERDLGKFVNAKVAVESSCAKGCVSWTTNYHPSAKSFEILHGK